MSDNEEYSDDSMQAMLPGRRYLIDKIKKSTGDAIEDPMRVKVSYCFAVGIDKLSVFNEAFGPSFTDEVIEKTGQRIRELTGGRGVVARINGDTYGFYLNNASVDDSAALGAFMVNDFNANPVMTSRGPVNVSISIGALILDAGHKLDPHEIIAKAELAMETAKEDGRGRYVCYNDVSERLGKKSDLLQTRELFLSAMRDGRVKLAFQPIINSSTGDVSFHESLLRVETDDGLLLPAKEFIPAIEKHGLSRFVDQFTLQIALEELRMFEDLRLSVNVSNMSLNHPEWLEEVLQTLKENPEPSKRLIIELTETSIPLPPEDLTRVIRAFQDCGCRVALDDFGSGYTAFAQLKEHSFDIVKIDKAFVKDIDQSHNHLFIRTLMDLANGFDFETVAEGAESTEDAEILIKGGVKHIQGYVYGIPSIERLWLPEDHEDRHVRSNKDDADKTQEDNAQAENIRRFWKGPN